MSPALLAAFAVALGIAVATPGPGILAIVSCSLGRGLRDALALICGIVLGDLLFFALAVLGMAALAHSMGELFLIVKLAGAAYLVYLGIKLWRSRPEVAPDGTVVLARRGFGRNLVAGLTVTLGNPKAIAFYAGLLPTFVDLEHLTRLDATVMGGIVVAVVGGIAASYALAADRARHLLTGERRLVLMNRTAGTMMIGAGVAVAAK